MQYRPRAPVRMLYERLGTDGAVGVRLASSQAEQRPAAVHRVEPDLACAFDHAAIGMALETARGHKLKVNRACCALLGYSEGELLMHPAERLMHREDLADEVARRARLLGGELDRHEAEVRCFNRSGEQVWVRLYCSLVRDAGGEPDFFIVQLQNIGELKQAAEQMRVLAQRTGELLAANRELETFSYSLAHDLRSPLSAIDGFSRALEEGGMDAAPGGRGQHCVARIRASVKQMSEMTEALLSLARLSHAGLSRRAVNLSELARRALRAHAEAEPLREMAIHVDAGLTAWADGALIERVVENLIGNAWKFTAGRSPGEIHVGARAEKSEGAQPVYFVRDNGAGFDMNHAGRLFEVFQRLHPVAEFKGTGIGLAIVHKIVARHGGRVWAEAQPGQGACFYFTLGEAEGVERAMGIEPTS